jgi:multiple sugar transport system substrate-binding protein
MFAGSKISRRQFLKVAGLTTGGALLAACKPLSPVASTQVPAQATAVAVKQAPAVIKPAVVQVQLDGWAVSTTEQVLADPLFIDFNKQTGIEIRFIPRTGTKEEELRRLADAVQAGTSPYDIIDFEDELTTSFSRSGYMAPLNDLLPADFWDDFTPAMKAYSDVWSAYQGELFRVIHNWEMPYWWYRKDWFAEKSVPIPTTWDETRDLGKVFTDEERGVWASEDTLVKGGYMNAYLSWITLQAGGNPFEVGDEYKMALEYIYDLMYKDRVLNPASLQTQILGQIADYTADRVAFMRQWPFFYDLSRSGANTSWFKEEKTTVALPPTGPGGKANSTYAASWGFGVVKTSPNLEAAKEAFKFLVSPKVAALMAQTSVWYVSARKSVLDAVGDQGIVKWMKMYDDAGVIAVRPHHAKFVEATRILEDTATAFLSNQITLEESMKQAKERLAQLGS